MDWENYWIEALERDLAEHEGFRAELYDDATGKPPAKTWTGKLTIGYGWNIEDVGITRELAELKLKRDIAHVILLCETRLAFFEDLSPNRKRAIANVAFNIGIGSLLQFKKALSHLKAGRFNSAAEEFLNSKWARQVKQRRAHHIADLIREG